MYHIYIDINIIVWHNRLRYRPHQCNLTYLYWLLRRPFKFNNNRTILTRWGLNFLLYIYKIWYVTLYTMAQELNLPLCVLWLSFAIGRLKLTSSCFINTHTFIYLTFPGRPSSSSTANQRETQVTQSLNSSANKCTHSVIECTICGTLERVSGSGQTHH